MNLHHAAALALVLALTNCGSSNNAPQDSQVSRDKVDCPNSAVLGRTLIPDSPYAPGCQEILRCPSEQRALVEGYRKCVQANAGDPKNCYIFMRCLNYSVVHGPHANP